MHTQPINYRGWMGLDSVEIVVRAEAFFVLICELLGVEPLKDPVTPNNLPIITEWKKSGLLFRKAVHLDPYS